MIYALIIVVLLGIDQISKLLALKHLQDVSTIPIINNIFHLTYVENRGAAFGMLQNNQIIFVVIALIASIFGIYYLCTKKIHIVGKIGIMLLISGALGNLIDRMRLGFVVDFLDFRIVWQYVFNIADVFVVVGTILLCTFILFFDNKEKVK
ncbi:signal peptidase II [Metaclostridioides mangenotii]|uniref:Lipoprotein signal peptidase n=1 Tax=Metaclostridioides mangenotii TaxID=1540 RepID=A0ABS4E9X8_9FIRM|nr:signal peptidase II [Clostridioides mangenotii]MBP1854748.1 signal peptidase II [Clostridioides mangenotii]